MPSRRGGRRTAGDGVRETAKPHSPRWRAAGAVLVSLAALGIVASPAISAGGARRSSFSSHAARPSIKPHRGRPFVPVTGDWEGTVDGFPASFEVTYNAAGQPTPYGAQDIVALAPNSCPVLASRYAANVISSSQRPVSVNRAGFLELERFGFAGNLTGARRASLSRAYHTGSCAGRLSWQLHPAHRRVVQDGVWKLNFADGESSRFSVLGGGRLASGIKLPAVLARCNGLSGGLDLFIGARGNAATAQPGLRASMTFTRARASGQLIDGCASEAFSAKLLRASF